MQFDNNIVAAWIECAIEAEVPRHNQLLTNSNLLPYGSYSEQGSTFSLNSEPKFRPTSKMNSEQDSKIYNDKSTNLISQKPSGVRPKLPRG